MHSSNHPILKGLANSILATILLAFVFSLFFYFTTISEIYLNTFANVIIALSVFYGSYTAAKIAESKILYTGLTISILYIIISTLLSILMAQQITAILFLIKFFYCALPALLGSVIGATLK